MSLNRVELSGNLTRDPKFSYLPSGAPLWEATVAVSDVVYSAKEGGQTIRTTYAAVQAWGWLAESLAGDGYVRGEEVYVLGSLAQSEIERRDGSTETKTRIRAMRLEPVRRRDDSGPRAASPPADNSGGGYDPTTGQGGWPAGTPRF